MNKFFSIITAIFFIVVIVWIFSMRSPLKLVSGTTAKVPLISNFTSEDFRLSAQCAGFTGHCEFPQYGLIMDLEFSGVMIKKPFYRLSLSGGNDGFVMQNYYFGTRILKIKFEKSNETYIFERFLWNSSIDQDFVDFVQFRAADHELYITTDYNIPGVMAYRFNLR